MEVSPGIWVCPWRNATGLEPEPQRERKAQEQRGKERRQQEQPAAKMQYSRKLNIACLKLPNLHYRPFPNKQGAYKMAARRVTVPKLVGVRPAKRNITITREKAA